jgi:hypothetical protein
LSLPTGPFEKIPLAHFLLLKSPAQQRILSDREMSQPRPRSLASAVGGQDQLAEIGNSAHALTNCLAAAVVNSLALQGKPREAAKRLAVNSQGRQPLGTVRKNRLALQGRQWYCHAFGVYRSRSLFPQGLNLSRACFLSYDCDRPGVRESRQFLR